MLNLLHLGNEGDMVVALPNDFAPSDDFVQVVPYGDYPHPGPLGADGKPLRVNGKIAFPNGVVQRIDSETGRALADELNAAKRKPNFVGRPWYVGHHDVDPIKYPDPKAYGWFKDLANRADGVYARVEWTPDGADLIKQKKFKLFSPLFGRAEDTGKATPRGQGIIRPTQLKSMAFTNNPNIDVMPLANESGARDTGVSTGKPAEFWKRKAANAICADPAMSDEDLEAAGDDHLAALHAILSGRTRL